MKSTQLLSVVLSLIMFTGMSAGGAAFADSELEEQLEDYCELSKSQQNKLLAKNQLTDLRSELADICAIADEDEREHELEMLIEELEFESDEEELHDLDDVLEDYCYLDADAKDAVISDYELEDFASEIDAFCDIDDVEEREDAIDEFIDTNFEARDDDDDETEDDEQDFADAEVISSSETGVSKVVLCHIPPGNPDKAKTIVVGSPAVESHLAHGDYEGPCDGDGADYLHDKYSNQGKGNLHDRFEEYCDLSSEELAEKIDSMHDDLPDDLREDLLNYCDMTDEQQDDLRDRIMDSMEHYAKLQDKMNKFDKKMQKFSDKSDRLKAMITDHPKLSDEKKAELIEKFEEKQGEIDTKISELKSKFQKYMTKMHFKFMSDDRKSEIHDRVAEMKAFKAELKAKAAELSAEEKQQLREDFIEKAKDMQLAWVNPRTQIAAGVDPVDVECREGFSLVMKESNGVAMCIKADTALKLIERGIVVPSN